MKRLSLRLRSFLAAVLALVIFVPLSVIALESAFANSLRQSVLEQLRVQSLTLISEFEMQDGQIVMPEALFNDRFNVVESGLYAFIQLEDAFVWSSISALSMPLTFDLTRPDIGDELFQPRFGPDHGYFMYAYTAEFEDEDSYHPVTFYILHDRSMFQAELEAFSQTLWYWIGSISFFLLIMLLYSIDTALKPISVLARQIKSAEQGEVDKLKEVYPPELEVLKNSINHLLTTEQQQRRRYKNSLADLAHSLKTPLAVLTTMEELPNSAREPLGQVDAIIQRQLKRAVAGGGSGWEKPEPVTPVVEKLLGAMKKVYADKALEFEHEATQGCSFRGDSTDLMEILGNVLDNACKAAVKKVKVTTTHTREMLNIHVEDDGPGIPEQHRELLLNRGTRLDTYQEGQGIGMALVSDLVSAYQGQIQIEQSTLGGARVSLSFML